MWTPCGYCLSRWATVWDHLQPWSKGGLTTDDNLYPACTRCNLLLEALSFASIQEKREYVRTTLIERGKWNPTLEGEIALSDLPQDVREDAKTSALLQPGVSEKSMGTGQKEYHPLSHLPNALRPKKAATDLLQSEMPVGSMAQSKSGKPSRKSTMKDRTCRTCLRKFTPRRRTQLFCDKICQESMGKGHDRLEQRLRELMRLEYQRMREELTAEITRQLAALFKRSA